MNEGYQLHPGVLFRTTREAVIIVQVETDSVYHFEISTAPLFEFFRNPHLVSDFIRLHGLEEDLEQIRLLEDFCDHLTDMNLLQPTSAVALNIPSTSRSTCEFRLHPLDSNQPEFTLDDVAFLYI